MESQRTFTSRMDTMSRKHFSLVFGGLVIYMAICVLIGALGPVATLTTALGGAATISLLDPGQTCTKLPTNTSAVKPRCWEYTIDMDTRLIQYFDVKLIPNKRDNPDYNDMDFSRTIPLSITWMGRAADSNVWEPIFSGDVSRSVDCAASDSFVCSPVMLFRTSSVWYQSYYFQVSVPSNVPESGITAWSKWMQTVSLEYNYRNPTFSRYEIGFKTVFLIASIILMFAYLGLTNCRFDKDKLGNKCSCLCMCFRRGASAGFSFQRSQGTKWLYAMVVGLFFFNEPLLGAQYNGSAAPQSIKILSMLMQFSFVVILLSYWLVEFGLLKSNAQNSGSISWLRFYGPKLFAMFLFWIVAVSVGGWMLTKQSADPMYDWMNNSSAPTFIVVWGALLAAFYLLYLAWLIFASFAMIKTFNLGERYLFGTHLVVLICTALGIAGGATFSVYLGNSFSLIFFNALYNGYVPLLVYLYAPVLGQPRVKEGAAAGGSGASGTDPEIGAAAAALAAEGGAAPAPMFSGAAGAGVPVLPPAGGAAFGGVAAPGDVGIAFTTAPVAAAAPAALPAVKPAPAVVKPLLRPAPAPAAAPTAAAVVIPPPPPAPVFVDFSAGPAGAANFEATGASFDAPSATGIVDFGATADAFDVPEPAFTAPAVAPAAEWDDDAAAAVSAAPAAAAPVAAAAMGVPFSGFDEGVAAASAHAAAAPTAEADPGMEWR